MAMCKARNSCKDAEKAADTRVGRLQNKLYLTTGQPVILTRNLWTQHGLVNGARGVVKELVTQAGTDGNPSEWVAVVEFEDYSGPAFLSAHPKWVPIGVVKHDFRVFDRSQKKAVSAWRKQLPLKMAWASTIHKAQGITVGPQQAIKRLVIDAGKVEHHAPGLLYVAISRAEYVDCIAFSPMPPIERFKKLNCSAAAQEIFNELQWYEQRRNQ